MSEEFKWGDSDTLFPTAMAVAVYRAQNGQLVIRQQGQYGDDDEVIFVPMSNVELLIEALAAAHSNWEVGG